jgi:uncharacterized protein YjbJ (UPF0337 family)
LIGAPRRSSHDPRSIPQQALRDDTPNAEDPGMNKDIIAGNWKQIKGKAQAKWGDLTDDVFDVAEGDSKYLAGKLQEKYGWDRDRAEREVDEFGRTLN